jgi:excisionase family DNA binding protein
MEVALTNQTSAAVKRGMTPNEAKDYLNVSQATLYRLLAAGALEAVKVGSRTLIPVESLDAFWNSLPKARFGSAHAT